MVAYKHIGATACLAKLLNSGLIYGVFIHMFNAF